MPLVTFVVYSDSEILLSIDWELIILANEKYAISYKKSHSYNTL